MKNKLNIIVLGSLMMFASLFVTSNAYADKSDKIIFADAYCTINADYPENPSGIDIRVLLADGIIKSTVDGSTSSADLKDLTTGTDKIVDLSGQLLASAPLEHICLSVEGNSAIVWQKFTTAIQGWADVGDLMVVRYVDNGDRTGTVRFRNVTKSDGITSLPNGCSQNDDNLYLQDLPYKPTHGIMIKDGAQS